MGRIHVLPQALVTAIAAGEVAERPAIILKELIENSLDAGATEIDIEIHQAGLRFLRVSDNGIGMSSDELPVAILRHTTSKIARLPDLEKITSYGFRGEALASIAAAADVTIISRPSSQPHASQLHIEYGQVGEVTPVAGAPGTTISVQYPFAHLPARRKFLSDTTREWRGIAQVLTQMVIAHPEVSWHITHNHRPIWHLPTSDAFERMVAVLGLDQPQLVTELSSQQDWLHISGWLGHPQLARSTQNTQFFYVNKRPVTWQIANRRVKTAFGQLLEARLEPFFIINFELNPRLVDVNVHPQKTTVKFMDEPQMLQLLQHAVSQTLHRTINQPNPPQVLLYPINRASSLQLRDETAPTTNRLPASAVTAEVLREDVHALPTLLTTPDLQEIWQFDKTYLLTMTENGILVFDQHAAHERILFEKLLANYQGKTELKRHSVSTPVILNLDLRDAQLLADHLTELTQLGFSIEPFGTTAYRVTAMPSLFADRELQHVIKELLDDLEEGQDVSHVDSAAERTIAYLACRNAVKAGNVLEPAQRLELINQLAACHNPHTCPHGRPTHFTISLSELEKRFSRR